MGPMGLMGDDFPIKWLAAQRLTGAVEKQKGAADLIST